MSNELESDSAMAMNLESFGVDGAGYDETIAKVGFRHGSAHRCSHLGNYRPGACCEPH